MKKEDCKKLLQQVKDGQIDIENALLQIQEMPYHNIDYARIDYNRELRSGFPEVIYSPGKTLEQIQGIVKDMLAHSDNNILASRADEKVYEAIKEVTDLAVYYKDAKTVVVKRKEFDTTDSYIAVVTAGTSDIPVAEEAVITATAMGNCVKRLYDVGVAGIHRLLDNVEILNRAKVIIVVAGMEGALASVVGGLTDKPVLAVPTSVGYGANFGGISALLGMLTSCANGIGVLNIDNGYGAACLASKINQS